MQIRYFKDTDTLLINFNNKLISETKSINENMLVELDEKGDIVSMTLEHAKDLTELQDFSFQQLASV